ncbi:MAG: hypothetical protein AAFN30_17095, partial [Actinomycetota bacterium]
HAEEVLDRQVRELATRAGASAVAVTMGWEARTAIVGGRELLVEGTVSATAEGAPWADDPLAVGGLSPGEAPG